MIYNITCSTDDNYLQHCMAMLCSVFENNRQYTINVHMLVDNSLSEVSRQLIKELSIRYNNTVLFYDINPKLVSEFDVCLKEFNGNKRFPMIVYNRLLLQFYLPRDVDRVLYLDCDIIVLSDLFDLFDLHLDGYGLAAIRDASPNNDTHRQKMGIGLNHVTFCSGVMMINMIYWRECDAYQLFTSFFSRRKDFVSLPDQDALNYVFRDKWFMLPYKWGKTPLSVAPLDSNQKWFDIEEYYFNPCILHFSWEVKPWMNIWQPDKQYYLEYLTRSRFPNPLFIQLNFKNRLKAYLSIIRYLLNKYIRPFVPTIIEILLRDIGNIIVFLFCLCKGQKSIKHYLLKRWFEKY